MNFLKTCILRIKHLVKSLFLILFCYSLVVAPVAAETLVATGSDTMKNLMQSWADTFKQMYSDVDFRLSTAGSSSAPPALGSGSSHFGLMSRKMRPEEVKEFELKFGYKPTAIRVAIDAIAVYVNKDNPVKGLSLEQVDAMFSRKRKCGASSAITKWDELGVQNGKKIMFYGRNYKSGTKAMVEKKALCNGEMPRAVREKKSSDDVIAALVKSPNSVGYSSISYREPQLRAVPLAKKMGGEYVAPNRENTLSGKYPLSRFLYIYVNKKHDESLPWLQAEFLKFVLSKPGQQIVAYHGFMALADKTRLRQMKVARQ